MVINVVGVVFCVLFHLRAETQLFIYDLYLLEIRFCDPQLPMSCFKSFNKLTCFPYIKVSQELLYQVSNYDLMEITVSVFSSHPIHPQLMLALFMIMFQTLIDFYGCQLAWIWFCTNLNSWKTFKYLSDIYHYIH